MRDTHGGIGGVDVLTARAAGTVGVHLEVIGLDINVDVLLNIGIDKNGRKGGVPPFLCVKGGDAYKTMHPDLRLELTVGVVPLN